MDSGSDSEIEELVEAMQKKPAAEDPSTPKKSPPKHPAAPKKHVKATAVKPRKLATITKNLSPATGKCDHETEPWVGFHKWGQSYFKAEWLAHSEMATYPTTCGRCKREFVDKKKSLVDPETEVKVTESAPGKRHNHSL